MHIMHIPQSDGDGDAAAYPTRPQNLCPDSDKFYGCPILKSLLIQDISYTPIER